MTNAVNIAQSGSNNQTMRNRIINGAMTIDQRNAGASVSTTTGSNFVYTLDRWAYYATATSKYTVQQNAGSVTPPAGFTNYLGCTSTSAYSVTASDLFLIRQVIEGFNTADLGWGTANAQPVTLNFWVRSSLTGTFGGAVGNSAGNRQYPFSFTISSANTWEQKSITIAGDTTGTWVGATNGIGLALYFSLGAGSTLSGTAGAWGTFAYSATGATSVVGTNGATLYITGVQLEEGTAASPFENRLYGQELSLCQRYYAKSFLQTQAPVQNVGNTDGTLVYTTQVTNTQFIAVKTNLPVTMRAKPTITTFNPFQAASGWSDSGVGNFTPNLYSIGDSSIVVRNDTLVGSAGANMSIHWTASAEL
jgi:hypothetical protein